MNSGERLPVLSELTAMEQAWLAELDQILARVAAARFVEAAA